MEDVECCADCTMGLACGNRNPDPDSEPIDPRQYLTADEARNEDLEALLNKGHYHVTPFMCSVGISADGERYAAVGIKLHGKSRNRKGKWTRCAIAASGPVSEGLEGLVPKMRKLYADWCAEPHMNVNVFRAKRRNVRSMAGK